MVVCIVEIFPVSNLWLGVFDIFMCQSCGLICRRGYVVFPWGLAACVSGVVICL